ncbi:hypothetical protein GCK32_007256, partial [Trichostrongylus colubriformis]
FMGCTHSKKNSKISSDKPMSRVYSTSASSKPKSVQLSFSTSSSDVSSETREKDDKAKSNRITPSSKHQSTPKHNANGSLEIRPTDNVDHQAPNPDSREAGKDPSRAVSRETPHDKPRGAGREVKESKEARKERHRKSERRKSRQPPQPINTFWDQEDHDFIVRKNIQRNQRRLHAMQDRDEMDDTLFEIPVRMPEVDFTNQTAVVA